MNKYGIHKNGHLSSQKEAEQVLLTMNATEEELCELEKWLKNGNSFYDNPNNVYDITGTVMNFIEAYRFIKEYIEDIGGEENDTDLFTELQQTEKQFEYLESDSNELPF